MISPEVCEEQRDCILMVNGIEATNVPRKDSAALFMSLSSLAFIPIIKTALGSRGYRWYHFTNEESQAQRVQKFAPGCRARSVVPVQKTECVFYVPRSGVFVERSKAV